MNVNNEEGRKNYRRLRNELKRATDNAKKEYLENTCDEIIEFQRTGHYDLMYMKTKELGWKENHGIQNVGIAYSQGTIIIDKRRVLKICKNYITGLYNRDNRPEHLEVEPETEVDKGEKGPYILQSDAEKARCTREIKYGIAIAKAAFNNKKTFHQQTGLKFKEETSKVLHLERSFVWC
jgi:hypothetical protein